MDAIEQKIDAVRYGRDVVSGRTHTHRLHASLDKLEPMLGGQTYIRDIGGGNFLATRSHGDTMTFPTGHPREGEPRYSWSPGPEGYLFGVLVEGSE